MVYWTLYASGLKCEVRVTVVETIDLESVEAPAWSLDFDGTLLTDIAFMGRSTSTARTQWLVVVGLPPSVQATSSLSKSFFAME